VFVRAEAVWFRGATALARDVTLSLSPQGIRRVERAGGEVTDVAGVLLPGLVDHHVHTELIDLEPLLRNGITEVRDLGADPERVFALAARTADADDLPRVSAAGPFLTAPGGYPTGRAWASDGMAQEIDGDAADTVTTLAAAGAEMIKVSLNADAGPVLNDDALRAIVATAHEIGLPVTAHAQGRGQPLRAAQAGVDELAHTPWTERLDDEVLRYMAKRQRWVSTVDIHQGGDRDVAMDNLRRWHAIGGRIRYGTDLGNGPLPLGVNAAELDALAATGMPAAEVLNAIACGTSDCVAVPSDPLADPAVLTQARTISRHAGSAPGSPSPWRW
jgi:imidazolonepropionase-like amidohydrolase